jgi:hypothetical protein
VRKLDLKERAQKRTRNATARPEILARNSKESSEGNTVSMSSELVGLYTEMMSADNSALRSTFFPPLHYTLKY